MKNHLTDTPAQFPGGEEALLDFLNKNIEYPDSELCDARTNPTVVVTFIVEKDGKIVGERDRGRVRNNKKMNKK